MTTHHIITLNYNAEKTFHNRNDYNPNRKHRVVLFDCKLEETESIYKFIKDDGREKTFNKSFTILVSTGSTPENDSFQLDVDEAF